jgi:hypothetical protein
MNPRNLALAAGLVLALTGVVAAKSGKGGGLVAGGRTVGGPGTTSAVTGGDEETILLANTDFDACLTFVNVGSSPAEFELNGSQRGTVNPGETQVACRENVLSAGLECFGLGDATCTVEWRVDAL